MAINVIVFGQLADLTGKSNLELEEVADTEALIREVQARHPALAGATYRIAVNRKVVTGNTAISDGSTIALLPPFSGG